jgi:lysophospholipase L1-like esterase
MKAETRSNKLFVLLVGVMLLGVTIAIAGAAELIARSLEIKSEGSIPQLDDPALGWLPKPGNYKLTTEEYSVTAAINALNMNDRENTDSDLQSENRILVVGDSHTFAVGAATNESWPKRVEARLFASRDAGTVWNAAVPGYSVGQYLLRFRGLNSTLRPTLILVGFSMATDLYDLIPPERGGFVYGGDASRVYFDLDPGGELVEKVHKSGATAAVEPTPQKRDSSLQIREFLEGFALYRRLKRSDLAMWVAVHQPGGVSLWPGLDTALKQQLTEDDRYRWLLAERILGSLVMEARESNAPVVVVNIPYLAQVYDATWAASFGARPGIYDRWIASQRLAALCQRIGALFIDTTEDFVMAARQRGRWLHWPQDAHPTPEGQDLIAQVVADQLVKKGVISK